MNRFLNQILEEKQREVAALRNLHPAAEYEPVGATAFRFADALRSPGLSIIAEIKRRSPSRGALATNLDIAELAQTYRDHGASAVSCLTDQRFFGALDNDLPTVRSVIDLPVLRKDFLIDERQLDESVRIGADAVLLIVRILSTAALDRLYRHATALGLDVLVEVHHESELAQALDVGATIIGVNNRDLDTFDVDLDQCLKLIERIPERCLRVAESGITSTDHIRRLANAGYDAALIGEALVSHTKVDARLRELRDAGLSAHYQQPETSAAGISNRRNCDRGQAS